MKERTEDADARLATWLRSVREDLANDPDVDAAQVEEIAEDLARHVNEALEFGESPVVTAFDVERAIARVGRPTPAASKKNEIGLIVGNKVFDIERRGPADLTVMVAGIALPAAALAIEFQTGMWAENAFDPIPTPAHAAAIGLVPVASGLYLASDRRRTPGTFLQVVVGAALGVSVFYGLRTLPYLPLCMVGVLYIGMGFVAASPAFALYVVGRQFSELRKRGAGKLGYWMAALLFALLLLFASVEGRLREISRVALGPEGPEAEAARETLRFPLTPLPRTSSDADRATGFIFGGPGPIRGTVSPWDAARLRWLVDGTPVGDDVFRVPSRETDLFGVVSYAPTARLEDPMHEVDVDADKATAYVETTLVFTNDGSFETECACVLALPEGGVAARASLWNRDVEVAAAFAPTTVAREAYESVVRKRRDPILVTRFGPDRVLLRCYPVPPKDSMRVRLGFVAPLAPTSPTEATLRLPYVLSKNFPSGPTNGRVDARLRGEATMTSSNGAATNDGAVATSFAIGGEPFGFVVRRSSAFPEATEIDDVGEGAFVVRQRLIEPSRRGRKRVVFALDGAASLKTRRDAVTRLVATVPTGVEIALVTSDKDGVRTAVEPTPADVPAKSRVVDAMLALDARGDRDDLPVLFSAYRLADATSGGVVVWCRGFQPYVATSTAGLLAGMDRRAAPTIVFDAPYMEPPAPYDALASEIAAARSYRTATGDVKDALSRLYLGGDAWAFDRSRESLPEAASRPAAPKNGGSRLARLYAFDRCEALAAAEKPGWRKEAELLSTRYGLVTAAAGAVALESDAAMADAGLVAPSPGATPRIPYSDVPEPETYALLLVGAIVCVFVYLRRGSGVAA
jgi:hypothetical protein